MTMRTVTYFGLMITFMVAIVAVETRLNLELPWWTFFILGFLSSALARQLTNWANPGEG